MIRSDDEADPGALKPVQLHLPAEPQRSHALLVDERLPVPRERGDHRVWQIGEHHGEPCRKRRARVSRRASR